MLNIKIQNCSLPSLGPCTLIGGHRGFGLDLPAPPSDGL